MVALEIDVCTELMSQSNCTRNKCLVDNKKSPLCLGPKVKYLWSRCQQNVWRCLNIPHVLHPYLMAWWTCC